MIERADEHGRPLCLNSNPQQLELRHVTRARPDVGRETSVDIHRNAASTPACSIASKQSVIVHYKIVVCVLFLQVSICDDSNVGVISGQIGG